MQLKSTNRDAFLIVRQAAKQMATVLAQAEILEDQAKCQHPGYLEKHTTLPQHRATMAMTVLQASAALQTLDLPTRHGHLYLATMNDSKLPVAWVKQTGTLFEVIIARPNALGSPNYQDLIKFDVWHTQDLKDLIESHYPKKTHNNITLLIQPPVQ